MKSKLSKVGRIIYDLLTLAFVLATLIAMASVLWDFVRKEFVTPKYISSYKLELFNPACKKLVRIRRAEITEVRGYGVRTFYDGYTSEGNQYVFSVPWAGVDELSPGIYVFGVGRDNQLYADGPYTNCPYK